MRRGFPELHEKHRVVAFTREEIVVLQAAVFCEDFAAQTLRNDLPDKFPAPAGLGLIGDMDESFGSIARAPLLF